MIPITIKFSLPVTANLDIELSGSANVTASVHKEIGILGMQYEDGNGWSHIDTTPTQYQLPSLAAFAGQQLPLCLSPL